MCVYAWILRMEEKFVNNQENSLFMLLKVWVLVDKNNNESKCLNIFYREMCLV